MIELHNISKTIHNTQVLSDVSFKISQGEVVVVIGPSGAGKTTLLNAISFIDPPSKGKIFIDENEFNEISAKWLGRKIGVVFQQFNLFPHLTVLENITYAPIHVLGRDKYSANQQAMNLLEKMGMADKASKYPENISGGQKQRVAIIRAMAMEPELLLFDEPTSALDPEKIGEVIDIISKIVELGTTCLIVSHSIQLVRKLATRVIFMEDGCILEDSPAQEFLRNPKTARAVEFLKHVNG